jgi:pimeloyl-ACP methyl ester carboxylesterase
VQHDSHRKSLSRKGEIMNRKTFAVLSALALALVGGWFALRPHLVGATSEAAVPTFSTAEIGRQGHFYVGGHYVGDPGNETMHGAMYVEVWVPKNIRHPYPVVFVTGGGGQGAYALIQTPDGRPGWAYDFVNQGYTVYMMDYPGNGRSAYVVGVDGNITPPRSGPLMEEVWSAGRSPSSDWSKRQHVLEHRNQEGADWPQFRKQTQWPGDGPNKGKMGDPVFDYFAKTELQSAAVTQDVTVESIEQLLDAIGQPVILVFHSGMAAIGWRVADARAQLVKGIVAAEPVGPPIQNAERGSSGPGLLWGLSNGPLHYDPPVKDPAELNPVREEKADGPDIIPCWVQKEPVHKLVNLENIPVLDVAGEGSYHRPWAHCVAKWLNQAGVKTTFVGLETVGLPGNGHQFMSEKNSAGIAKFFMSWLDKNVH